MNNKYVQIDGQKTLRLYKDFGRVSAEMIDIKPFTKNKG